MAQGNARTTSAQLRIELVLGGGGIKGFGHIGFLKAIEEQQINTGKVTGVSIGSAVAALYTNGYQPEEITGIFLKELVRLSPNRGARGVRVRDMLRGGINLKQMFEDICSRYELKPRRNLRILAFNVLNGKPVVFEGCRYDLSSALAASCSVPGVMRPVWYGQKDLASTVRTVVGSWRGRTSEGILVDGGVHHPAPGEFCKGPAIISKLGIARSLPSEWLSPVDLFFHMVEVLAYRLVEWYYPDPRNHLVIKTGMPNVACLTFGISEGKCLEMVEYGYRQALPQLEAAVKLGRVPVK